MARPRNEQRLDRIYDYIKRHPGLLSATIAKQLGYDQKIIDRALPQLADRGDLLYEEKNKLYKVSKENI